MSGLGDEEDQETGDYPLANHHWINTPLARDGEYKTFLHLALDTSNIDLGMKYFQSVFIYMVGFNSVKTIKKHFYSQLEDI